MFRDKDDKWTRERGFWEVNRGDILTMAVAVICLLLFVGSLVFLLGPWRVVPEIPGLNAPAARGLPQPSHDQKFHYSVPGETEVLIFPGKPIQIPMRPPQKPQETPE